MLMFAKSDMRLAARRYSRCGFSFWARAKTFRPAMDSAATSGSITNPALPKKSLPPSVQHLGVLAVSKGAVGCRDQSPRRRMR
ncbi:hypothetical protein AWB75_05191 [Caballeronia catudaia]|uniref:Uncharacterized protein n=1 Tax=Caballeronia catudaia TaxID=1777136 RepID=A0A158CKD4_9BURK|nr:hypothetical protein [Caballeronia catudaia]SAK81977.1 hypothetical protein AWB75_05191 [Caballeronia catudaia]